MKIETFDSPKQVLGFVQGKIALSVLVDNNGAVKDELGRMVIPAGTPVGGDNDTLADEQAVLTTSNDAKAQGVLEHEVDVSSGVGNGTLIIAGYVNENRLPDGVTISAEAKKALAGKVIFFKRNA